MAIEQRKRKAWNFGFKPSHFKKELKSVGATEKGIRAADKLFKATLKAPELHVDKSVIKKLHDKTGNQNLRAFLRNAKPFADITLGHSKLGSVVATLNKHNVPYTTSEGRVNKDVIYFKAFEDAKRAVSILEGEGIEHKKFRLDKRSFEEKKGQWYDDWWNKKGEALAYGEDVSGSEPFIKITRPELVEEVSNALNAGKVEFKYQRGSGGLVLGDQSLMRVWKSIGHKALSESDGHILNGILLGIPIGDIIGYFKQGKPTELEEGVIKAYHESSATWFSKAPYWPDKWKKGIDLKHLGKFLKLWSEK